MSVATKDGKPFHIGMTVVTEFGREIKTDPEKYKIESVSYQNYTQAHLSLIDGQSSVGINTLYSSQEARIDSQIRKLEKIKTLIDKEIEYIKQGGSPEDCEYLF